jgi:hypothetical protein
LKTAIEGEKEICGLEIAIYFIRSDMEEKNKKIDLIRKRIIRETLSWNLFK